MHADQIDLTVDVVAHLVAGQFPQWAGRPVRPVASDGTVNALFRVGDDIVLRFPLLPAPRAELLSEQENARRVAPHVPLEVPEPLAMGEPGAGYPGPWAVYRWIPGTPATVALGDPGVFAQDLAGFVRALHGLDTGGRTWSGHARGRPLQTQDASVRSALAESTRLTDTGRLTRIWDSCLAAAAGSRIGDHQAEDATSATMGGSPIPNNQIQGATSVTPVWVHADLMPGNLLVRDGRLAAVIDLGTLTIGDPAVDLMPAWNLLPPGPRETYRHSLGADDAMWARGMGWALMQAIVALPYYAETNPGMARTARHTLDAILAAP